MEQPNVGISFGMLLMRLQNPQQLLVHSGIRELTLIKPL
jgi:hypothetical protein